MSENDVADMAHREELFPLDEEEAEEAIGEMCECTDPGCQCGGVCAEDASAILFRVDMEDETGTPFCECCAEDATASGLFRREED